jgi:hypothetical protein
MDQDHDFTALRELLASTGQDMPQDTQVDQFLIEFHRRQRAQLLVPQSMWARSAAWMQERIAGLQLVPSLSYAGAVAAIAVTVCLSLSQEVKVTHVDGQSKLAFRMPARDASFAMVPVSLGVASPIASKAGESPNFTSARNDSSATRYVLATNSHGAYDATVAF